MFDIIGIIFDLVPTNFDFNFLKWDYIYLSIPTFSFISILQHVHSRELTRVLLSLNRRCRVPIFTAEYNVVTCQNSGVWEDVFGILTKERKVGIIIIYVCVCVCITKKGQLLSRLIVLFIIKY